MPQKLDISGIDITVSNLLRFFGHFHTEAVADYKAVRSASLALPMQL